LKELRPPLLIVRGQETDTFFPSAARMVKQRLPQAVIHTVPGTGHLLPMEKPEEVRRVIFDFLDKIDP
jgi:pimeloyl-ACP methyl ester carboxylesterase